MNRHFKLQHVIEKFYKCPECGEKFARKLQLKQHSFRHTGEFPYKCEECNRGFCNQRTMLKHQTIHNDAARVHTCQDCSQKFQKWSELMAHRKISHAARYECDLCHKKFFSKMNLRQHFKIHQPKDDRIVYQCHFENCPKFYFENRNLTAHIRSKHEGKKFVCDISGCGRALATKQKLEQHKKLHRAGGSPLKKKTMKKAKAKRKDAGQKVLEVEKLLNIKLEPKVKEILRAGRGHELKVEVPVESFQSDTSDAESIKTKNFICVNRKLEVD